MNISIRVDSSEEIGFGHLYRCINLAKDLKSKGAKITFICRNLKGSNFALIRSNGFVLRILKKIKNNFSKKDQIKDYIGTIKAAGKFCDLLIVDHYQLGYFWEKMIKKIISKLMVVDDFINRKHYCDIILNYSFAVKKEKYKKYFPLNTKFLLGPKFALINKSYQSVVKKNKIKKVKNIFLHFGTDSESITTKVVNDLIKKSEFKKINLEVVLTKNVKNFLFQKRKILQRPNTKIYYNLPHLSKQIKRTQIGIVSGGQIVYECMCSGLPIIIFQTANNQELSCKHLAKTKNVYFFGRYKKNNKIYLETLKSLILKKKLRLRHSLYSNKLVDGNGVQRATKIIYRNIE